MEYVVIPKVTLGLYILGAAEGKKQSGALIDAVAQVSLEPVALCASLLHTSATCEMVEKTGRFSLSVLGEDVEPRVLTTFGYFSSRDVDKWASVDMEVKDGLPFMKGALAHLSFRVIDKKVFDSHTMFIGVMEKAIEGASDVPCLTYEHYQKHLKDAVQAIFDKSRLD